MFSSHYLHFLVHNLKTRSLSRKIPLLAGYKITYRCNLQCKSCPFWKLTSPEPSFAQVKQVLNQLWQDGIRLLIFEGGEPFLWHDGDFRLEDVIQEAQKKFFSVGVTTNGTLPIHTNADTVWVSLDGLPETHFRNRGVAFEKILQNIEMANHPNLFANITINRLNYQELPALIRFLRDRVKGITVQFYYPFANTEDLWLPLPQRILMLDQLIALKKSGYPIMNTIRTLQDMKSNSWRCHPWLIGSVEPDGTISYGCYLENRAEIACEKCGFAAHVELSKAHDWHLPSILIGHRIFKFRLW